MKPTQIREKLHQYINKVDEKKLEAIYTIFEGDMEGSYTYSKEEIEMFYQRRKNYLNGKGKDYSVEESVSKVRQKRHS